MIRRIVILVYVLLVLLQGGLAKSQTPDRHGEVVTTTPEYRGLEANAPIPPEVHFHNEGGSDGAGLCVICSVIFNGIYQGVPGLDLPGYDEGSKRSDVGGKGSELWKAAKKAPGGYGPEKLAHLVERVMPGERYVSYLGDDYEVLKKLSAQGYPVAVTMSTSSLYGYRTVAHMVSGVHFDDQYACIVDNNDPGRYYWMPKAEFMRRWVTGSIGWAWWWMRLPMVRLAVYGVAHFVGPVLILLASACLLLGTRRRLDACSTPEFKP